MVGNKRRGLRGVGFRIHLDPVIPHPGADLLICRVGDDYVRRLHRHVAIDAVVGDGWSDLLRTSATLPLVAAQTLGRV